MLEAHQKTTEVERGEQTVHALSWGPGRVLLAAALDAAPPSWMDLERDYMDLEEHPVSAAPQTRNPKLG